MMTNDLIRDGWLWRWLSKFYRCNVPPSIYSNKLSNLSCTCLIKLPHRMWIVTRIPQGKFEETEHKINKHGERFKVNQSWRIFASGKSLGPYGLNAVGNSIGDVIHYITHSVILVAYMQTVDCSAIWRR